MEFDERKPPQAVFNGLLTYLQNTDQAHCSSESVSGLHQQVPLLQEALALVNDMINLQVSDEELRFAVSSTRAQLENIYEVYGLTPSTQLDQMLIKLSRGLDDILKQQSSQSRSKELTKATSGVPALLERLDKYEASSAFNRSAIFTYLELIKKR